MQLFALLLTMQLFALLLTMQQFALLLSMQLFALLLTMQMLITVYNVYSIGYQATMLINVFFFTFPSRGFLESLIRGLN